MIRLPSVLLALASLLPGGCQALVKDEAAKDVEIAQREAPPTNALRPPQLAPAESQPKAEEIPVPKAAEIGPARSSTARKEPTVRERLDALVTDFGKDGELSLQSPLGLEQVDQSVVEKLPLIQ